MSGIDKTTLLAQAFGLCNMFDQGIGEEKDKIRDRLLRVLKTLGDVGNSILWMDEDIVKVRNYRREERLEKGYDMLYHESTLCLKKLELSLQPDYTQLYRLMEAIRKVENYER